MSGRFAPSPTGDLHLGNLRTAVVAWLSARTGGHGFVVRMEDLDRHQSSRRFEQSQLADLAAIGLDWDGDVVRQSERFDVYRAAIDMLAAAGLVYECFCTRREIQDEIQLAAAAPHRPPGSYPGTCRDLDAAARRGHLDAGRRPALRLRTNGQSIAVTDRLVGRFVGAVDDVVLCRNDGVPAYNLAVVVDDAEQGVTEIVRGDDLLSSTPRQALLQDLLGLRRPSYLHVPLVMGHDGHRLAKRHGAVTLAELAALGITPGDVIAWLGHTLGLGETHERLTLGDLLDRYDPQLIPRHPIDQPLVFPGAAAPDAVPTTE